MGEDDLRAIFNILGNRIEGTQPAQPGVPPVANLQSLEAVGIVAATPTPVPVVAAAEEVASVLPNESVPVLAHDIAPVITEPVATQVQVFEHVQPVAQYHAPVTELATYEPTISMQEGFNAEPVPNEQPLDDRRDVRVASSADAARSAHAASRTDCAWSGAIPIRARMRPA